MVVHWKIVLNQQKNDYKYFQVNQIQCWFTQLAMGLGMSFNYFYIYMFRSQPTTLLLYIYIIIRHNRLRTSK